jgi:hypothetical protein
MPFSKAARQKMSIAAKAREAKKREAKNYHAPTADFFKDVRKQRVISVSNEVYEALVKEIKDFKDTPDSVLRRLLNIK